MRRHSSEAGETLVGVLVALLLGSVVLSAAASNFSLAWRQSSDQRMVSQAETEARTLLDIIAYDLRMMGTGMPLGQSGFLMTDAALGTAALPIFTTSSSTLLSFRLNERGTSTVLTTAYTPSAASLVLSVVSTSGFAVGNTVYLSDMPVLGTAGFGGTVSSVTGTHVTVTSIYSATAGTTFAAGSILEPVSTVTYTSGASGGITRDNGSGAVLLSPRSSFTARYLDSAGTVLTPPLSVATIQDSLAAVDITVSVSTPRTLLDGESYMAEARQSVALRNLNINR